MVPMQCWRLHGRGFNEEGLETRIRLEKHYLPDASLERQDCDAVISNSLLHHVQDPVALWRTATKCVRPNSPVLVVDLLRPADPETVIRLVNQHAGDAPSLLRRDFIASLHAAYSLDEVRQQLLFAGLPHFCVEQVDELHLVAWGE